MMMISLNVSALSLYVYSVVVFSLMSKMDHVMILTKLVMKLVAAPIIIY